MTAVSQNLSIVLPLRAELWSGSPTKTRLPKLAHEAAGLPKQNGRMETHCLADDAVSCEPVSAPNSLLTGKLAGNFAESISPLQFRRPVSE
jgi:hypothetical protein